MKKTLLIAGGGTLGTYTSAELLRLGNTVDVICLEDKTSDDKNLCFYKANADLEYLTNFLKDKYYDGIVNFIHYTDTETYKPVHQLLSSKTDHLIFLSSYRVYADIQHPVTESAPHLFDTVDDEEFLKIEDYAVPKSKNEHYIREESGTSNWTIVRPVISFSDRRLDVVTVSGWDVIECAKKGEFVLLPEEAKNLTAGLDWAGNSGKIIARLLMSEKALGEDFTVSSAQNLTWGEVAEYYTEILGTKFEWVDTDRYVKEHHHMETLPYILKYDRLFDRMIDNRKVLEATGLKKEDFTPVKEGIKIEIDNIKKRG